MSASRFGRAGVGEKQMGLVGWLEQTRVRLPLKGVECRFVVCGGVVEVWIDQIFHQSNKQALNCTYQFPLPADAAVYRCEMEINERLITARVEEKEQARKMVKEQKAAGRRTVLAEMEEDNLFTLGLGNVQPEDVVVVRLRYFQPLRRLGNQKTVEIPTCPGVRYVPGKPLLRSDLGFGNRQAAPLDIQVLFFPSYRSVGDDPLDIPFVRIEEETEQRLFVIRVATRVGFDNNAQALFR